MEDEVKHSSYIYFRNMQCYSQCLLYSSYLCSVGHQWQCSERARHLLHDFSCRQAEIERSYRSECLGLELDRSVPSVYFPASRFCRTGSPFRRGQRRLVSLDGTGDSALTLVQVRYKQIGMMPTI